ncbi:MAG: YlxR family protein [Mycoplasmataceae bacterium]|nr:YlxR family protein [Mycoplasmataceae bacterium]
MKVCKRKCIATHKLFEVSELIRVVKTKDNKFFVDSDENGRGAYIWVGIKDISILRKHRLLNRAFKGEVPSEVYDILEDKLKEKHER